MINHFAPATNFEPDQLNTMLFNQLQLKEYLRTRKGQQPELDKTIQSLMDTIDLFSKEFSDEVQKFSSSIMKNDSEQKIEGAMGHQRRFMHTPLALRPVTQTQKDAMFFGVAGGVGAVLMLGLFRRAAVSAEPAMKNAVRNLFRR